MVLGTAAAARPRRCALCTQLARTCTPEQVQIHLVDMRRTLLGVVDAEHLAGYLISTAMLGSHLAALAEELRGRLPGVGVTQQQLRDRSWWAGPEMFFVVDDYELIAGAGTDPLTPLLEFLPHARDIGLHVVIARRAGGAARAMFNPVPATMRELGCTGLMMSAGPDEALCSAWHGPRRCRRDGQPSPPEGTPLSGCRSRGPPRRERHDTGDRTGRGQWSSSGTG